METKRELKLGSEKCGPEFGPDKRYEEEGTFEGSEKGQDHIFCDNILSPKVSDKSIYKNILNNF